MRLHDSGGGMPYGIALAAAALVVYPQTGWMPGLDRKNQIDLHQDIAPANEDFPDLGKLRISAAN